MEPGGPGGGEDVSTGRRAPMHPFTLFAAAGLMLLASWFGAEALGAWDRVMIRRALACGPCPRLRAAQVRSLVFSSLGLVCLVGGAVVLGSGLGW